MSMGKWVTHHMVCLLYMIKVLLLSLLTVYQTTIIIFTQLIVYKFMYKVLNYLAFMLNFFKSLYLYLVLIQETFSHTMQLGINIYRVLFSNCYLVTSSMCTILCINIMQFYVFQVQLKRPHA